jgi:hypothetical protein
MLGLLAAVVAPSLAGAAETGGTAPAQATPPPGTGGPSANGSAVIRPPAQVDPGINRPPPSIGGATTFPMPVVPPPGAPGGNPNVVPK